MGFRSKRKVKKMSKRRRSSKRRKMSKRIYGGSGPTTLSTLISFFEDGAPGGRVSVNVTNSGNQNRNNPKSKNREGQLEKEFGNIDCTGHTNPIQCEKTLKALQSVNPATDVSAIQLFDDIQKENYLSKACNETTRKQYHGDFAKCREKWMNTSDEGKRYVEYRKRKFDEENVLKYLNSDAYKQKADDDTPEQRKKELVWKPKCTDMVTKGNINDEHTGPKEWEIEDGLKAMLTNPHCKFE